jgi:cytochrome c553
MKNMKFPSRLAAIAFCIVVTAPPTASWAAGDPSLGLELYTACASCHGGDGRSTSMSQYPKIGGQNEAYLVNALKAYRDGRRQGTFASIMAETAKGLSDQDIANLASYVASLAGP